MSTQPHTPPSLAVTMLRHCRCMDCRKFRKDAYGHFSCDAGIGGVGITWGTGERLCDPLPDAWHYCAEYDGPQNSPDVWVWPATSGL